MHGPGGIEILASKEIFIEWPRECILPASFLGLPRCDKWAAADAHQFDPLATHLQADGNDFLSQNVATEMKGSI